MPIPLPLETPRLTVRDFVPALDAEAMVEVYCDSEVMRFIPGGALDGEDAVRVLLSDYAAAQTRFGFSSWAVVERDTGRLVGDAGFGMFAPTGDIELGYTLARRFWGLGYATEAARACLMAGLRHLNRSRIIAAIDLENVASLRVAERLGMTRTEELLAHGRPHLILSTHGNEVVE